MMGLEVDERGLGMCDLGDSSRHMRPMEAFVLGSAFFAGGKMLCIL